MRGNTFVTLRKDMFKGCKVLRKLNLARDMIQRIPSGFFDELGQLTDLWLYASRSAQSLPHGGAIRFRFALRAYAPRGVRVDEPTQSIKNTHPKNSTGLFREQVQQPPHGARGRPLRQPAFARVHRPQRQPAREAPALVPPVGRPPSLEVTITYCAETAAQQRQSAKLI